MAAASVQKAAKGNHPEVPGGSQAKCAGRGGVLASDALSYITAQTINVTAGCTF